MPHPIWLRRLGYGMFAMLAAVVCGLHSFKVEPVVAQAPLSLVQQAQARSQQGETNTAIDLLTEAVVQFAAQGDTLNQAMALGNLAALYLRVGQGPAATPALNQALNLATAQPKSPEQQRLLAQLWDVQGQQSLEQGQPQAAIESLRQAAALYATLNTTTLWLHNQLNQAHAFQSLGLYPRACQTLLHSLGIEITACELPETALKTLATADATPEQVMIMTQLANALRALGQLDRAAALLATALAQSQPLGLADLTAMVTLEQGNVWRAQAGQPTLTTTQRDRARQAAIAAYEQTAQATQPTLSLQAQANLLSFLVATGDQTAAIALWQDLKPGLAQLPPNRTGLEIRLNLAESLLTLLPSPSGRGAGGEDTAIAIADVEALIKTAVQQATTLGHDRLQAYALGSWGRLAELQGQPTGAIALTQRALALVPPFQAPEVAYPLFWQLGRLQADQGEREAAIAAYSQALQILASLRGDLVAVNPEVQFSFREQVEPIYREFVRLLVGVANPSQGDLQRARQVIESLQVAELDNFFQDACAETQPQSIDQLDQTAAVIYPIILPDRLTVIVSIPNQPLLHYSTAIARSDLESSLRDLRLALQPGVFPDEYVATAQSLYDLLIRPAADQLTQHQIKTLVFVLDGYLRNVPMAVLNNGEQFLVDQYNLALTPGLQLLASQPLGQTPVRTLMGGLAEGRQGFSPLPAVAGEVAEIAAQVPAEILLNQTFTRENLQTQMTSQAFPVVHLATHGQFSSQAEDTFILTWDDRISVKQLDQLLRSRTQGKQTPLELLVLSACETARGDDRAALGLAGVAVRSGARSTLATLWQVNDISTAAFMAQFYQELTKPGMTKAQALRNAQIALKQQPDFQNPFFWAPFILVGNWL
ncbi:CHAT domain-containing protein [Trichothermofontia sp.]